MELMGMRNESNQSDCVQNVDFGTEKRVRHHSNGDTPGSPDETSMDPQVSAYDLLPFAQKP
jgi:hypothetical protein